LSAASARRPYRHQYPVKEQGARIIPSTRAITIAAEAAMSKKTTWERILTDSEPIRSYWDLLELLAEFSYREKGAPDLPVQLVSIFALTGFIQLDHTITHVRVSDILGIRILLSISLSASESANSRAAFNHFSKCKAVKVRVGQAILNFPSINSS